MKILNSLKDRDKIFRQSKSFIISTIDKVKDAVGLKKALKAFGISYQQCLNCFESNPN